MNRRSMNALALTISMAFSPAWAYANPQVAKASQTAGTPVQQIRHFNQKTETAQVLGPSSPHYRVNLFYDSQNHRIRGKLSVTFTNHLQQEMQEVYFHLRGNAKTYQQKGGKTTINHVRVNGRKAGFQIKNHTALHITGFQLPSKQRATVSMDFEVNIPHDQGRFGWHHTTTSLENWLPVLAVYDHEKWNVNPYSSYGENFYNLPGNYDITLTTDKHQVIAATGIEIGSAKVQGNLATHRYQAKHVRDFSIHMDPGYQVISDQVRHVRVNVYYTKKHEKYAETMLKFAVNNVESYIKKHGSYPWPELDVVGTDGRFGEWESPQLLMISQIHHNFRRI